MSQEPLITHTYTFDDLRRDVVNGCVDTVLACQVDMQGRLMGKRLHASYFLDHAHRETHSCNYLLATDMEMNTVPGYAAAGWDQGYGDHILRPDLTTLRKVSWLEGTALVLCDVLDPNNGPSEVPHSPRAVLKRQVKRLESMGLRAFMATELEFFIFNQSYEDAWHGHYRGLQTLGRYNEDYHIFQTTMEEQVMRALRNGLHASGIPVESTKGEASAGQEEINVHYAEALEMADRHAIIKNACKEIAWQHGKSITFLAKWNGAAAGSSAHIHQSLWSADGAQPLFLDESAPHGMSTLMRHYVAGLLAHTREITYFLAPYVNSYKRFAAATFAPTKIVWSRDNRTAGYRLCGEGGKDVRIECRIGGADLNPYLAMAALIAAGINGIERKLELPEPFIGDAYALAPRNDIPRTLRDATETMNSSQMLRDAFGEAVVDHYVRAARWEQEEFERHVTDWEVQRGFERC